MHKEILRIDEITIAVMASDTLILTDAQSALDLAATVSYWDACHRIVLFKESIAEDFFKLSTGLAGEVLQKFVNFHMKLAIVGDFSDYTSKPLHDFIVECNRGSQIFFVPTQEEAVRRLAAAG